MPKGEKIRGVNGFSTPCCYASCSDPMRVVVRLWVWESLKTLFYEIMLLCDFICFGYGHVFLITVSACHILSLDCFIFIWSAVEIWLLCDWYSQDGSAALWGRQCRPLLYQPESCVLELIKPVICIMIILVTLCSAPHSRHGCRGRFPSHLKCESWSFMPIWEFKSLFTYLGGGSYTHGSKISV